VKYLKNTLKNGLRVILVPVPTLKSATVTVWAGVGSRYEDEKRAGLSHFLEHMVFKGSKKRPTAKEIAESIDAFGGEFNASTSKEWTNFYIKARSEKLGIAIDVLADMVLNPILKNDDIQREKGVIVEEIAMYDDTPMAKIGDVFENVIFEGNELARDIVGTKETVKAMERADFVNFRDIYYSSNNIVITISGGFDERKTIGLIEDLFSGLEQKENPKIDKFVPLQKKPRVHIHTKKNEQAHFIMGFLAFGRKHKDRFTLAVLSSLLGGGMSSRMFTEVREKRGLAYSVKTSVDRSIDTGYIGTYAGVDLNRVDEAVKVVLEEHEKLLGAKHAITKKELEKAKEYLKGHLALSLEDTRDINAFFGVRELLDNELEKPEDVYRGIEKVSSDDLLAVAKELFVAERLNFAIIGPFEDEKRFEKIVKI
jgi:predicted Zn-dependent peptidase